MTAEASACARCGEVKPATAFLWRGPSRSKPSSICKECGYKQQQEWRLAKRDANRKPGSYIKTTTKRPPLGHKFCVACDGLFLLEQMHKRSGRDTPSNTCKTCFRIKETAYQVARYATDPAYKGMKQASSRANYQENAPARRKVSRAYKARNPEASVAQSARRRARIRAIGGTFSKEHIQQQLDLQNGECYYCGVRLITKKGHDQKYQVDHFIPITRGGSNGPENIVCACPTCNRSKTNKLPAEWMPEKFSLLIFLAS